MPTRLPQISGFSTAEIVQKLASAPATTTIGPVRSLYIHIPFCFHKCHYCDFYSLVDTRDRQAPFIDRLLAELAALAPLTQGEPLRTIFIGGGTPTLLALPLWERLLGGLATHFDLADIRAGRGEFTVECNPETASAELFALLRAGGVDRLSMGAQSFDPRHLKTLERWHDPASVSRAVALARAAGFERLSLDLIFAVPGQTLADWAADLDRALDLGITHLSAYGLTYEPNTAMTARLRRGQFAPCEEDLEADMYEHLVARCANAGLDRYEVSNFAVPGQECAHNLAYWRQHAWLAAGPSASAHLLDPAGGSWRWKNQPRLDDYLRQSDAGLPPALDIESPEPRRLLAEQIMTGLRLREGIDLSALCEPLADADLALQLDALARTQIDRGLFVEREKRLCLTDAGFLVADAITREFLAVLS